jgi:hypothetical protein
MALAMSPSDYDPYLQDLHYRSVGRLLAADVFDATAFDDLISYLQNKAELIKHEHIVSKQVLNCLLSASQAIESRAEYLPELRSQTKISAEFSMILGLIAIGEAPSDRRPGAPRIL